MTKERGLTRRQIFKKFAGATIGSAVTGSLVGSTLRSFMELFSHVKKDQRVDTTPYYGTDVQISDSGFFSGKIVDTKIGNIPAKLVATKHTRRFAEDNYLALDTLVQNCSIATFERAPGLIETQDEFNDAKAYFGIMVELCKRYNKPVIFLNPWSASAELLEDSLGLFGVVYASWHSYKIVTENSTRKDFLMNSMKTAGGVYFFFADSLVSEPLEYFLRRPFKDSAEVEHKIERCLLNHTIDQVNVQLTNRLLSLSNKLNQKELQNGRYILFNFGGYHVEGVDYYLHHPIIRGVKSLIYRFTYDLADSNSIVKFTPDGNAWTRVILN